jgi:hypothetical protein
MMGDLHFHRGYSLRLQESKPLKNNGIISFPLLGMKLAAIAKACSCSGGTPWVMAALLRETKSNGRSYHREKVFS